VMWLSKKHRQLDRLKFMHPHQLPPQIRPSAASDRQRRLPAHPSRSARQACRPATRCTSFSIPAIGCN
jgi:hypothetical protein